MTRTSMLLLLAGSLLLLGAPGCHNATTSDAPLLRVHNVGSAELSALRVSFPDTLIGFGNVGPGVITEYRPAPRGVYAYAAFRFNHLGQEVIQRVEDWVGESPLPGQRFTYSLELIVTSQNEPAIIVRNVTKDQ